VEKVCYDTWFIPVWEKVCYEHLGWKHFADGSTGLVPLQLS
jgi:hypothetical protein